jgi:hypothetical protein
LLACAHAGAANASAEVGVASSAAADAGAVLASTGAPVVDAVPVSKSRPAAGSTSASGAASASTSRAVDQDVQTLKKELVDLNRDLFRLEEELLYPSSTQVAVFLSMNVGTFFALDSVQLRVDGKEVANYLYTEREVEALHRGGVQKLYLGNLKAGKHELVAVFTGKGPHERDYRRGTTLEFEKAVGARYLELRITDREAALQPEFTVRQWD